VVESLIDFTDHDYQSQLADHQRSTAVQSIRNNLKSTELQLCDSIATKRQLVSCCEYSFLILFSSLITSLIGSRLFQFHNFIVLTVDKANDVFTFSPHFETVMIDLLFFFVYTLYSLLRFTTYVMYGNVLK